MIPHGRDIGTCAAGRLAPPCAASDFSVVSEDSDGIPLGQRMDDWCEGRDWHWRALILVLFVWQAVRCLQDPMGPNLFGGINFGAHEFGHLFFSFGGEWLTVAGGSLMQLLVPIGAAAALAVTAQDWFGVAACGTWLASSFANLAPYIADARAQDLDLLSFSEDGAGHDWHYLLAHAGRLKQDTAIARSVKFVSALVLVISVLFALSLLLRMARSKKPAAMR